VPTIWSAWPSLQHDFEPGVLGVSLSKPRCINRLSPVLASFTSKTRYRAFVSFAEVVENMERERGLEPPAPSLGRWLSFENKDYRVFGCLILATEFVQFLI
jgi:hypothetical protein